MFDCLLFYVTSTRMQISSTKIVHVIKPKYNWIRDDIWFHYPVQTRAHRTPWQTRTEVATLHHALPVTSVSHYFNWFECLRINVIVLFLLV